METLGFDRLGKGDWIDYKDENVIVAYDLINKLPSNSGDSFKLGVMAIVFCGRGRLQLDIDGITHTLQSNEALICGIYHETPYHPIGKGRHGLLHPLL